jgi:hypothetical protein
MGLLDFLLALKEKRRLKRRLTHILIWPYRRDSFRYYTNGRFVTVPAELHFGEVRRIIDRGCKLNWDDRGVPLSPRERDEVFQHIIDYFERRRITWVDRDSD